MTAKWRCDPVQPNVPNAPVAPTTLWYQSDNPPIEADEYAAVQAEVADLRRQLAEANTWAALQAAIAEGFERQLEPIEAERLELRRQLAECQAKLAAIPLAALRRAFYTGYSSDAQVEDDEIAIAAWLEVQP